MRHERARNRTPVTLHTCARQSVAHFPFVIAFAIVEGQQTLLGIAQRSASTGQGTELLWLDDLLECHELVPGGKVLVDDQR
jgi:hypothetical protein